jgi:hypothetical protein
MSVELPPGRIPYEKWPIYYSRTEELSLQLRSAKNGYIAISSGILTSVLDSRDLTVIGELNARI